MSGLWEVQSSWVGSTSGLGSTGLGELSWEMLCWVLGTMGRCKALGGRLDHGGGMVILGRCSGALWGSAGRCVRVLGEILGGRILGSGISIRVGVGSSDLATYTLYVGGDF